MRSIYADWEQGDFSSREWADPEMEFVNPDGQTPGSWTGLTSITDVLRDFLGAWEHFTVEVKEYRELDDERVLVLVNHQGHGKTSGMEAQYLPGGANLFHVRNGKVKRLVPYWDRNRAFADLDLSG